MLHLDEVFGFDSKTVTDTLENPKLKEFTSFGFIMSKEEYLDSVSCRGFIDDDGHGHLATATQESDYITWPSDTDEWPSWATHIVWYNK